MDNVSLLEAAGRLDCIGKAASLDACRFLCCCPERSDSKTRASFSRSKASRLSRRTASSNSSRVAGRLVISGSLMKALDGL